jgi:ribosome biogenesis protein YTM1
VPSNLTRYGLSQIINHLLALGKIHTIHIPETPAIFKSTTHAKLISLPFHHRSSPPNTFADPARPFDFLIDGQLLRLSLHKHLTDRSITAEATLEIEYLPVILPPEPKEEHTHDDWVSAVAPLPSTSSRKKQNDIVTGAYDGIVRFWSPSSSKLTFSFTAHDGPVRSVIALATNAEEGAKDKKKMKTTSSSSFLLTAGADCQVKLWKVGKKTATEKAALVGHTDALATAAVSPNQQFAATGGWDTKLLMYRLHAAGGEEDGDADNNNNSHEGKKKRLRRQEIPPLQEFSQAHTQCISSLCWPSHSTMISGSWDHRAKAWDVETGTAVDTVSIANSKAILALATSAAAAESSVVALGCADRTLRLWDRRTSNGSTNGGDGGVQQLKALSSSSHDGWITSIAWHPSSLYHLATASHDGTSKLWDVRANVPLTTLTDGNDGSEEESKALCCCWVDDALFACGVGSQIKTCSVNL